jgi:hypothetical protein
MTSDLLSSVAGAVLSLLFSYLPGLSAWYGTLTGDKKRLIMLGALALVAGGMYALDCGGLLVKIVPDVAGMCSTADGWVQVVRAFVLATIANQAAFLVSPKS